MTTSVIITAYNLEKYIGAAIESVLAQTQKPDEIIIIDDDSNDRTAAIIALYSNEVSYYKMQHNSGGLSTTFYGVKQAKGDILLFLDGDDVWMPEKIESVLPLFQQFTEMAVVSHDYVRVDANRKPFEFKDDTQKNIMRILERFHTVEEQSEAYKDSILGKRGYWGGSAYAVRRKFIDIEMFEAWKNSFPFIRNTYLDLVLPTFIIVNRPDVMIGYVHKKLFEYRIHANNTSGNRIPDIKAAKKALRMGHCTTLATHGLLKEKKSFIMYAERQALAVMEYEYLVDIYDSKKIVSAKKFIYLSRKYWKTKQMLKEAQRFLIAAFFGPKMFLYLKNKLK
jgi:glycosyltransferase involved in cell wall biosynthesis